MEGASDYLPKVMMALVLMEISTSGLLRRTREGRTLRVRPAEHASTTPDLYKKVRLQKKREGWKSPQMERSESEEVRDIPFSSCNFSLVIMTIREDFEDSRDERVAFTGC